MISKDFRIHSWPPPAPEKGDIVWINLNPTLGSEQSGRRPVLVLSPFSYNDLTGHCIVCPITSKVKGYSFEVALPAGCEVSGVCLVDHVKNQNWKVRNIQKITSLSDNELIPVQDMLTRLLFG